MVDSVVKTGPHEPGLIGLYLWVAAFEYTMLTFRLTVDVELSNQGGNLNS